MSNRGSLTKIRKNKRLTWLKVTLDKVLYCVTYCDQMSNNELTNITQHGRAYQIPMNKYFCEGMTYNFQTHKWRRIIFLNMCVYIYINLYLY